MLDFDKMPLFKYQAYKIIRLIPIWSHAYGVEEEAILRQLPIAYAWIQSNPAKAPRKQMTRFLNTWMRKAREFGNLNPTVSLPPPAHFEMSQDTMDALDWKKMKETLSTPRKTQKSEF